MWSLEEIIVVGGMFVTVIGALVAVYSARANLNKTHAETTNEDAQASESYAAAARSFAEEVSKLRLEVKQLRIEMDARDKTIKILTVDKLDLQDWAERLVHQVKSLGAEPVPFRPSHKATN